MNSPEKGDDRDAEEDVATGGLPPFMASTSIKSGVLGMFSMASRFTASATLVLAVAFATLGGLEDGVDVFGVHVRVGAAYVLEDRADLVKESCRVALAPSKIVRFMLLVKVDINMSVTTVVQRLNCSCSEKFCTTRGASNRKSKP